ncbi:hypothetical protein LA76x_1831 [Lysobacter antibioticus]|uniref:Uncharacterized protein n=1 Tax=Lysobacter antibioticus TaxID=84531 RepID=A0A0S2F8X0_LYSAN|nr:hypothetical protein LA76x_1831 [Lysobacter antibioticus]
MRFFEGHSGLQPERRWRNTNRECGGFRTGAARSCPDHGRTIVPFRGREGCRRSCGVARIRSVLPGLCGRCAESSDSSPGRRSAAIRRMRCLRADRRQGPSQGPC